MPPRPSLIIPLILAALVGAGATVAAVWPVSWLGGLMAASGGASLVVVCAVAWGILLGP